MDIRPSALRERIAQRVQELTGLFPQLGLADGVGALIRGGELVLDPIVQQLVRMLREHRFKLFLVGLSHLEASWE